MIKINGPVQNNLGIRRHAAQMNKELIMDSAARLFSQSSFESVTLDDIARSVGATKGLIYHHFPSKRSLLGEFTLWFHDLFLQAINPSWYDGRAKGTEKLRKVIAAHIDFCFEYQYMLGVILRTGYAVPPDASGKIRRLRQQYVKRFTALVDEVQKAGHLIEGDSKTVASCMIDLISHLPDQFDNAGSGRRKELYELMLRMFFR